MERGDVIRWGGRTLRKDGHGELYVDYSVDDAVAEWERRTVEERLDALLDMKSQDDEPLVLADEEEELRKLIGDQVTVDPAPQFIHSIEGLEEYARMLARSADDMQGRLF